MSARLFFSIRSRIGKAQQNCVGGLRGDGTLLQFGVLRPSLLKDGNVRVGILPEREEVLISVPALGGVAGESIGACQANVRKSISGSNRSQRTVIEDSLEFSRRLLTFLSMQVNKASHINGEEHISRA